MATALSSARRMSASLAHGTTGRRVALAAGVGVACGMASALQWSWQAAELLGWDAASLSFVVATWLVVGPKTAAETRAHAQTEDPGAALADVIICIAALACIVGAGIALARASTSAGAVRSELIALAALSVLLSWAAIHTVFALRYARLYYGRRQRGGGIDFHDTSPPDYLDFAYVAMTIGMTFQVSDTDIAARQIRRTALKHALLSWVFGAVLVGLTINILASLLSASH